MIFCQMDQNDICTDMRKRKHWVNGEKKNKAFRWVKPDDPENLTKISK